MTILLVIGILVFLIVIHELGHFAAAKLFGVRVDEFGVGYPPRAFRICKIGDTEYTLNWIPFGGFVRLFGDEGEKQHGAGALMDASRGARALILGAGVLMNVIAGWALFAGALHAGVPRIVDDVDGGAYMIVTSVVRGSPAESAGLKGGDRVHSVQDAKGNTLSTLTPGGMSDFVADHGGKELTIVVERTGTTTTIQATPAHAIIPGEADRPALGVGLALVSDAALPWSEALPGAFNSVRNAAVAVISGLWTMASGLVHGTSALQDVVGPIGLVSVVGDAAKTGYGSVLSLAAFISVNLAVINLIPIPALDGGRLLLLAVESVRRKDAPRVLVQILNGIGIVCILLLMVIVTYQDIVRLFS